MYLIDTSVFLELLLDQEKAEEVEKLLRRISPRDVYLSEFSFYSVGIVLLSRKMYDTFMRFVNDLLMTGGVGLKRLSVEDTQDIVNTSQRFNLDFDDAYQYTVAKKYNLTIVSFDSHFDRTDRGRKTPAEILKG